MSPPELPGFYYDEEKRKYFRIVNGDQRVNTAYSNNTIRAKERRDEYISKKQGYPKQGSSKKQKTENDHRTQLSRACDISRHSVGPLDQFLRIKLGLIPPERLHHHVLSDYHELGSPQNFSIWPSSDNQTCFTVSHSHFGLMRLNSPRISLCARPELRSRMIDDPSLDTMPKHVACIDKWILLQVNKALFIFECSPVSQDNLYTVNLTERIVEHIIDSCRPDLDDLNPEYATGTLQRSGESVHLYLLLSHGYSVIYDLTRDRVVHHKQLLHPRRDLEAYSLQISNGIWGFYSHKQLFLVNYDSLQRRNFSFESQIYYLDLKITPPPILGLQITLDIIVVTQKKVLRRQLDFSTFETSSVDQTISIHNDNQSSPLISKCGDCLVVEEFSNEMKIIDFANCTTEQKVLRHGNASRSGKPRLVCFGQELFWSDSKTSFKLN